MTEPPSASAEELRWTVHPASQQKARSVAVAAIVLVAAGLCARVTDSAGAGVFALALLLLSLRAWFLPRTYLLDRDGAGTGGPLCRPQRLAWSDVRRVSAGPGFVHLSPRHSDSRLLPDRGLLLRTACNRAQVSAFVASHRSPA